jgi:hypothetical protein
VALPSINDPDGRRYWAFLVILGGCFIFTLFAAVGVWLVSGNAYYSLILALAAHAQLFVGMGAFSFVLGRRMRFKGGKDGLEFDDSGATPVVTTTTTTEVKPSEPSPSRE